MSGQQYGGQGQPYNFQPSGFGQSMGFGPDASQFQQQLPQMQQQMAQFTPQGPMTGPMTAPEFMPYQPDGGLIAGGMLDKASGPYRPAYSGLPSGRIPAVSGRRVQGSGMVMNPYAMARRG